MYWLRIPEKVYFKKGCMPVALDELKSVYGKKKAFIVTDLLLYKNGAVSAIEKELDSLSIQHFCYFNIKDSADFKTLCEGAKAVKLFEPDVIVAFGSGTAIDSAKLMRFMYEYPEIDIREISSDFNDITCREKIFPKQGIKSFLTAIPDINGNASEVSPYAVFYDNDEEYIVADYELMPDMAVVDGDFMLVHKKEQAAKAGLNALVRAVNAFDSQTATEYTDGFAEKAIRNIIDYLPEVINSGSDAPKSCEKLGEAITMSAIAYANTSSIINVDGTSEYLADIVRISAAESEDARSDYAELGKALGLSGNDEKEITDNLVSVIENVVCLCGIQNKQMQCDV